MARITASVYTSHVPAIGAALDLGKTQEPYWQKVFAGYEYSKQWLRENTPPQTGGVAVRVVHEFHAVDVDERHRRGVAVADGVGHRHLESRQQRTTIGQTGERVVLGVMR